jgi:hypothetical protein
VLQIIKRFLAFVVLAGASAVSADSRVVLSPSASLDDLTAALVQGHGGDQLIAAARERRAQLSGLIQTDPGQVLRMALPDGSREALSPRVRRFVEERVELEGTLQVFVEDRPEGSRQLAFLESDWGERYALYFASQPTRLLSGARVKVTGLKIDKAIAVESGEKNIERLSGGTSGVVVHLASFSDPNSSDLLDMAPTTTSWNGPALDAGQIFTDAASGVTITVNSITNSGASVTVNLGNTPTPTATTNTPTSTPTSTPTPTNTPPPGQHAAAGQHAHAHQHAHTDQHAHAH